MSEQIPENYEELNSRQRELLFKDQERVMKDIKKIKGRPDFFEFLEKYYDTLVVYNYKKPKKSTLLKDKTGVAFLKAYNKIILNGVCHIEIYGKRVIEVGTTKGDHDNVPKKGT